MGLFHVSPFSVRLPGLLFGILYLWSVWRLARLFLVAGWVFLVAVVLAALVPLEWDCFFRANGTGTALALQACAIWLAARYLKYNLDVSPLNLNLSGACLGLSVATRLDFAIPAILLGFLFLAAIAVQRKWADWRDRILIPPQWQLSFFWYCRSVTRTHQKKSRRNSPQPKPHNSRRRCRYCAPELLARIRFALLPYLLSNPSSISIARNTG